MAESEVKSAALWLGKVLTEEIKYLGGVTGKVRTLQTELNALAAFIQDAVMSRRQDARVQTALSQARRLAYECEDVIDTYILKVARHGYEQYQGGWHLGSAIRWTCILREAVTVHKIRSKIDALNRRILSLKADLGNYGVSAQINSQDDTPRPLRRVYTHEREERVVVGLERDVEDLVGRLTDPTNKTVIAITGMGGLGKSTLAFELYHHPKIREGGYFKAFGWGHASQRLQPDLVLKEVLNSLVPEDDHDGRARIDREVKAGRAHATLYEMMRQSKCVVVVDDIWTSRDWEQLEAAFPRRSANGSRVILTSRYQDVLSSSVSLDHDQVHLHPITGLDNINSWKLFRITAFPGGICTDVTKERLGQEIILHCKGVPMAIVIVGKALKRKERVEDWVQMRDNILTQIKRGGGLHKPYKEVYDVLQVSYDVLPHHLKQCFLHFANFPEDDGCRANRLYHLWAGEGIVAKEHPNERFEGEGEEEIGERYLEELVSRNMVQVERWGNGRILRFKMHDLMRDVCVDIAKREGFFQSANCQSVLLLGESLPPVRDKGLRSLAVHVSIEDENSSLPRTSSIKVPSRAPNLRSLILFPIGDQGDVVDCTRLMETICKDYPLLRVFDCQKLHMTGKLPKKIGNLIHLRYLSLQGTRVTELSSSIERLLSLQTLDLVVDDVVKNLVIPNVLWKMKNLTYVYLPKAQGRRKMIQGGSRFTAADLQRYSIKGGGVLKLSGLCNLHTLTFIDLDRIDLKDLSNLETVRCISVMCDGNKEFLHLLLQSPTITRFFLRVHANIINEDPLALSRCQALNYLEIYAEPYANIHLRLPAELPNNLFRIQIWYAQLDEDPLPILEKLPHLTELVLHMCYNGQKMACSSSGFPRLASLFIEGLPNFNEWEVEQGALQNLKVLDIKECALEEVPNSIPTTVNLRFPNSSAM